tara:strand:+ start:223 stop:516 length:294 start_codon:yes stop_codon:yes gene_type:complete
MEKQRIRFKNGKQKAFLDKCITNLNLTSLRGLLQLGLNTSYDNLKNYYTERRALPENLFQDLIYLAKINPNTLDIKIIQPNWGQIKGGQISKRVKSK